MTIRSTISGLLLACATFSASADGITLADYPYSASVELTVSGDGTTKSLVQSYLGRELRSLKDVQIVEEKPDFVISVIAMDTSDRGGHKTGVVFSVVVLKPFNNRLLKKMLQPKYSDTGSTVTAGLYSFLNHYVHTGADSDVQRICAEMIATFDSDVLEPERVSWRKLLGPGK